MKERSGQRTPNFGFVGRATRGFEEQVGRPSPSTPTSVGDARKKGQACAGPGRSLPVVNNGYHVERVMPLILCLV